MKNALNKEFLMFLILALTIFFLTFFSIKTARYAHILEENITRLEKELTQSANHSFKVGPVEMSSKISGSEEFVEKEGNRFYVCVICILLIILGIISMKSYNYRKRSGKEAICCGLQEHQILTKAPGNLRFQMITAP